MSWFDRKFGYYTRMLGGLHELLRTPQPSDWDGLIRQQLENREARFLDTVERAIFSDPAHPYYVMFEMAGCRFGDLAEGVQRDGLDATLHALLRNGVYLAHDEFKGKMPIVRSGREIPAPHGAFRNPLVKGRFEVRSGGSRSSGTVTRSSIPHKIYLQAYKVLIAREFAMQDRCHVHVAPILPARNGIVAGVGHSQLGHPIDRWFSPTGAMRDDTHYRLTTQALVAYARLWGERVPFPTFLPPNDFSMVSAWIAQRRREGRSSLVKGPVSAAVRIAAAAGDHGHDLRGTIFTSGGEALTDAKRAAIEATGAEVYATYGMSEIGKIGVGCRQMTTGNCVHLFEDSMAVISRRRRAPLSEVELDSLHFTSLLPSVPHLLINVEMDDSGVIEPARCDCVFSRLGFHRQIRDISSFGKLTGQGMTLFGTDILRLLEESLPQRFGGSPTDYQLVEREGKFQTELTLRISPRVRLSSTEDAKQYFLHELRRYTGGAIASRLWRDTEALEVVAEEPFVTPAGKVLSLHLLGSAGRQVTHAS